MENRQLRRRTLCAALMGAACALAFAGQAAAAQAYRGGPGSLTGVWTNDAYRPSARFGVRDGLLMTAEGEEPPLQPWAKALTDQRVQSAEEGRPFPTTMAQCLPAGMPQMMFGPRLPIQILETPGQVTILFESMTNFRIIPLNQPHAEDPDVSFFGDSVGHWEDDTLVVDTIAINDRTTLDPVGMPHSEALHLVERFRRTGPASLELQVTMDDPKTFTRPWTARTTFKTEPGLKVQQYFCENQRNPVENGVMQVVGPGR